LISTETVPENNVDSQGLNTTTGGAGETLAKGLFMSRNYSPKNFLRKTPNALLKQYFQESQYPVEINWDKLAETEIDPIYQAINILPEKNQIQIEDQFRQINEMACDKGIQCLREEGESSFHNLKLADLFREMNNPYERAFWMLLNHSEVFSIAESLFRMDNVGTWKHCTVFSGLTPKIEAEDLEKLADYISTFYKKQGRGKHCQVDNYLRQNPERHCYFAYPEDYAKTELEYNKEGNLENRVIRPAFEVIFVYRPESGILETNARGKADDVKMLQEAFCQTILGLDKLPNQNGNTFDLEPLKTNFAFPIQPQDGIKKVYLRMLQLKLPGGKRRRITFEEDSSGVRQPIYTLIETALNQKNIPMTEVEAIKAKIQFQFEDIDGKKGKTVLFEIAAPDRCTLKDAPLHQIAKKYLEEWKLLKKAEIAKPDKAA